MDDIISQKFEQFKKAKEDLIDIENSAFSTLKERIEVEFKDIDGLINDENNSIVDIYTLNNLINSDEKQKAIMLFFNEIFDLKTNRCLEFDLIDEDYGGDKINKFYISKNKISVKYYWQTRKRGLNNLYYVLSKKNIQNSLMDRAKDSYKPELQKLFNYINLVEEYKTKDNIIVRSGDIDKSFNVYQYISYNNKLEYSNIIITHIEICNKNIIFHDKEDKIGYNCQYQLEFNKFLGNLTILDYYLIKNNHDLIKELIPQYIKAIKDANKELLDTKQELDDLLIPYQVMINI